MQPVTVIGAGLAGSEAAWQLVKRGIPVTLYEMRPGRQTPAHTTGGFAELVCSNSLRSDRIENAAGLLKEEMRLLDSLVMRSADAARLPAGGALAVDRETFSDEITRTLCNHELCTVVRREITEIPQGTCIIAAGPLCDGALAEKIRQLTGGDGIHFYDAAAPIVTVASLDMSRIFRASRYGRGDGDDYLNCPMTQEEYYTFVDALLSAEVAPVHGFDNGAVFEGCMPVEVMASRGRQTLAFGPLKPVGLIDPRTGRQPYAVLQLRQDDAAGTICNLVGFQTHLKFAEQKRVFGMIPGLENAEFVRYGVMHRNTFICSPQLLDNCYCMRSNADISFAGQITGVEGYLESTASGLLAAISVACRLQGKPVPDFTRATAIGALGHYVSSGSGKNFQPMNVNFGIMEGLDKKVHSKAEKAQAVAARALQTVKDVIAQYGL